MATCQTKQHNASTPYVQLTVSLESSNAYQATLAYTLKYIATSAASTSVPKNYSVVIGGAVVDSGTFGINGVTGTRTICSGKKIVTKARAAQTISCSCSFGFNLSWSSTWMGTLTASTSISVDAKDKYTITYNANGGSGVPSTQYKWYGESLTLSSTKPTRTGYTFQGWGTSSTDTSVDYQPGAGYTANAAITLYAIWKVNTYKVTYNANGGSGEPAAQTKTYGQTLTLTTSKPTRTNYTFKGWATTATGAVYYQSGGTYTKNAAITLYAVWELSYVLPKIYNVSIKWADDLESVTGSDGVIHKCIYYYWEWETTFANPSFNVSFIEPDGTIAQEWVTSGGAGFTSGDAAGNSDDMFRLRTDKSYTIKIKATDSGGSTTVTTTLAGDIYPIDVLAEGKGISFGGPATLEDTAHFQWNARFDKAVFGNVPGMNRLPEIPANDDFNNYMTTGCWAVYRNDNAETIANIPVARAGRLEVWSATGEGIRAEQWSYLRQRFIPYNNSNATWERDITRGENNVWTYYDWHRTTLTPEASKKIYSKAAIVAVMSSNVTLGVLNAYTKVPLDFYGLLVGDRLMLQNGAVKIGANINYVKVSGQALVKCGAISGDRHVRIQRVTASGTVMSEAWVCLKATSNSNTLLSLAPIIVYVEEGDTIQMVYYTPDTADSNQRGSSANGWQTYMTVEEL